MDTHSNDPNQYSNAAISFGPYSFSLVTTFKAFWIVQYCMSNVLVFGESLDLFGESELDDF
jgi:hypothetical protein